MTCNPANANWPDLPNVDWPQRLLPPSTSEILEAAAHVAGLDDDSTDSRAARAIYTAAAFPWLMVHSRMSTHEASQAIGQGRRAAIRRDRPAYAVMTSPAGRAIAQAMGCRLREIVRNRMEQTQ